MELKSIKGKEIFAAGTWNGDQYTTRDLDEMVRAFEETSQKWKPPIKLGHTDDQKLLQEDGLPAAGWVERIYRVGEKLYADIAEIPQKVYELLQRGAYKHVSSEVFWGIEVEGKKYDRMLAGVALLGLDMPAVTNLDGFLALYGIVGKTKTYASLAEVSTIKSYQLAHKGDPTMPTIEELQAQVAALETEKKDHAQKLADAERENAQLKQFKAQADARAADAALDAEVSDLVASKLCTPAMKPYVKALLGEEKKNYSIKPEKGEEKKYSKKELLGQVLKLFSAGAKVNSEEGSVDTEEEGVKDTTLEASDKEIQEYAAKHKVDYSTAAKALIREKAES
jgi:hypothetical protein